MMNEDSTVPEAVNKKDFLERCLLLDIEINEEGNIYSIGAVLADREYQTSPGAKINRHHLIELEKFGDRTDCILGHNILAHDIPHLQKLAPDCSLFDKPAIDTLYLSPLAFPANPYHRLVKDYQIVRDSVNNPVQDAKLAGRIFLEQWDALCEQLCNGNEALPLYRGFFKQDKLLAGTESALAAMGVPCLEGDDLIESFGWFARKHGCAKAVDALCTTLCDDCSDYPAYAYVAAWLSVAGGNSVLPSWVRHNFPVISESLHKLREHPCEDRKCEYCSNHHNPHQALQRFFGFDDFRPQPSTPDGESLQGEVVKASARNLSIFATLPTGGGKSLCYLLPALMRYQRRNMLTIVISPLQALMKDQVDNFSRQTGTRIAAALYGLLTMPERAEVLEGVRLGDIGVLYVSPEQLRNHSFVKTISQREIGAWVFDEAHCLSKWGHDFRPDYFYAVRFIREFAVKVNSSIPAVQCFTATAKRDVRSEIIDIIQSELGLRVVQFEGGHERTNLHYEVYSVDRYEKYQVILDILQSRYDGNGSVVVYCATQKNTENLAEHLQNAGYSAEAFHAGLESSLKKRILEQFVDGDIPVICATNAFGMGIDKDDVRLVIHADIPGSLENYLQEAGRAGRDRMDAECILVFDEQDIEGQFRLSSMSRLKKREIAQMWYGIRNASRGGDEVVLTAGELLRRDDVSLDPDDLYDGDTRVRTAVAWLERAGFLERNENNTRVFQGKPMVVDMEEAAKRLDELDLSERQKKRWFDILEAIMAKKSNEGFSTDELAGLSSFSAAEGDNSYESENQRVLRTLHDMAEQGLLSKETTLSAYIRYKVSRTANRQLERLCRLEDNFIRVLQEAAPDADVDDPLELDLRQVNQQLVDLGYEKSTPHALKLLLYGLSRDGKGLAGQTGSINIRSTGNNRFAIRLRRTWETLHATVKIRQQAANVALRVILDSVDRAEPPNANLLVEFTLEQIVEGLKQDLALFAQLTKPLAVAERALTFMHEQGVIDLQQGLAIFNQAMTLRLYPEARKRRYTLNDFSPLQTHYTEKNFQIHVMNEYARKALEKISTAMRLVSSYFNDDKDDFVSRYFPGRKKMLERATSEQSFQRIVDDLKNKAQSAIVSDHAEKNMLVLAGPGAGKTRVVTHRVAYLLRVERISPDAILVLCFNRSAVMSLRKKLRELVGNDMSRVTTLTFHGLALRLTGRSLATAAAKNINSEVDFSKIIQDAINLLKGDMDALGLDGDSARETLIGRFSHILVDEYQDVDAEQYELVSLLAGKKLKEKDRKMTILAVGDDDQNIYQFRGANVEFIRKFHEDYKAEKHYLIENYRSTGNIIAACNALICRNVDRMKTEHAIRVNEARQMLPRGGNWQIHDRTARGLVQLLEVSGTVEQAYGVVEEVTRLKNLSADFNLNNCAVLAREWNELDLLRSVFEARDIPVNLHWGREGGFPALSKIRENADLLAYLKTRRIDSLVGSSLLTFLPIQSSRDNFWQANLRRLLEEWIEETHNTEQPVARIEEYLYESLADQGRARNLGNGVFLSTVHSVKGLEFDHVFMLGGSWQEKQGDAVEEERRLYYVGMSRARETLQLFTIAGKRNPYVAALDGDFLLKRKLLPVIEYDQNLQRYELLGMKDLFIDFAGFRREEHPSRKAIEKLDVGEQLQLTINQDHLELVNNKGIPVARLSKSAEKKWRSQLGNVLDITVKAVVKRNRDTISDEEYKKRCFGEFWEVPIVEVCLRQASIQGSDTGDVLWA